LTNYNRKEMQLIAICMPHSSY